MRPMIFLILFSSLTPLISMAQNELAPVDGGVTSSSRPVITLESHMRRQQQACQALAQKHPDLVDLLDLSLNRDSVDNTPVSQHLKKCWAGASGNLKDIFHTLITEPAKALAKVGPGLSNSATATRRYLEDCNLSVECKSRLFEEAHGYSPSGSRLENLRKQLTYAEIDVLHRSALARMNTTFEQNRRQQQALEAQRLLQNANQISTNRLADNKESLWLSLRAGVYKRSEMSKCLKADVWTEYFCYYVATAGLSIGAVGLASKFPRAARIARVSTSADDVVGQAGAVRRPTSNALTPQTAPPPTNSMTTAINANSSAAESRPTLSRAPLSDPIAQSPRITSSRIPDRAIQGQPAQEAIAIGANNEKLGTMVYSYDRQSGHLIVDSVKVDVGARGNGVNQRLLENAVRENPGTKTIRSQHLTETNERIARQALDSGSSCESAIRGTPAYRTRANLGFTIIQNASCEYRRTRDGEVTGVSIRFDATRP